MYIERYQPSTTQIKTMQLSKWKLLYSMEQKRKVSQVYLDDCIYGHNYYVQMDKFSYFVRHGYVTLYSLALQNSQKNITCDFRYSLVDVC